jgi:hypothetical protein
MANATVEKARGVRTTHPQYDKYAPKWQKCRDAATGESAVHAQGQIYLPKLAEENDKDFKARLDRTPFFNATWRTISGLRGMLFKNEPDTTIPAGIAGYLEDVDLAGSAMQTFAQEVVQEALTVGRVGVLVDYPQAATDEGVTVAEAARLGMRPSLQRYPAETITNWKVDRIGSASVLSLVVLTEQAAIEGKDEYCHDTETRYRVLDLGESEDEGTLRYRQRVFRINKAGEDEQVGPDVVPLLNGQPLNFIPFEIMGVDCVGPKVEEPPLMDLVDMNFHHYRVSADYEHGCHFSGLPTLFISGFIPGEDSPKIYIGGPGANCLPDTQSKAYFVETQGDFTALRTNLEDKKLQMAVLGARMLEQSKRAAEAADTVAQHRKGEESLLSAMSATLTLGLERALTWFAAWAGVSGKIEYKLNDDFAPVSMSAQDLTAIVAAWQAGAISREVLFDRLQEAEVIEQEVTYEEEQARIASAAPQFAPAPITP